jgi:isopentenyl-diphosphate delta-isomerase
MPRPAATEAVILVNAANRAVGRADKIRAHEAGLRHRAFSIFLVDERGRVLLQRRHRAKYHSGGLWANSCCGHPRPGERTLAAARRRLGEELGATGPLRFGFRTRYAAELGGGLRENEIVYVYFGSAPTEPLRPDPREISATEWTTLAELKRACRRAPEKYAFWLKHYLERHDAAVERGVARARSTLSR